MCSSDLPVIQVGLKLAQDDERWLWPHMAWVIQVVRPRWIVWENVPGLLTRGLGIVHRDIVRLGYRHRVGWATACSVGAPHARRRLFGLAHATGERWRSWWPGAPDRDVPPPEGLGPVSARSAWWAVEPDLGRVAYGVPAGPDRRRALGNAVVPQVAEHIGRLVMGAAA